MGGTANSKGKRLWYFIEERGVYFGLKTMFVTYRLFGRRGFALLLYPVMSYFFLTSQAARGASRLFLERVHETAGSDSPFPRVPGWRESFRHFLSFGDAILDKLAAWRGDIPFEEVHYVNRALFEDLKASGRGGVLIASHLGNMEVCRALGNLYLDLKINVLVHTKHSGNFNRLMREINPRATLSLIQVSQVGAETAMMLREKVEKGEFVVIVGDRTPVSLSSRIAWLPFLGHPAPFPEGPFYLAAMMKCPVLVIFCLKRDQRYHIIFEPLTEEIDLPRRERKKVLGQWVSRYVERLQHYALSDPNQWFNFFDFWGQARTNSSESKLGAATSREH